MKILMQAIPRRVLLVALRIDVLVGQSAKTLPVVSTGQVVIIDVDGISPNGIQKADTPNVQRLRRDLAFTLHARDVTPTVSSPN